MHALHANVPVRTAHALAMPRALLSSWRAANSPAERMLFRSSAAAQSDAFKELAVETGAGVHVIGTHNSKSIVLPVVLFVFGGGTACAVVRDNFYDHKVTILADDPVDLGDAAPGPYGPIHGCYCEGFPSSLVCGTYHEDARAFTVETNREGARAMLGALARHVGSGLRLVRKEGATK